MDQSLKGAQKSSHSLLSKDVFLPKTNHLWSWTQSSIICKTYQLTPVLNQLLVSTSTKPNSVSDLWRCIFKNVKYQNIELGSPFSSSKLYGFVYISLSRLLNLFIQDWVLPIFLLGLELTVAIISCAIPRDAVEGLLWTLSVHQSAVRARGQNSTLTPKTVASIPDITWLNFQSMKHFEIGIMKMLSTSFVFDLTSGFNLADGKNNFRKCLNFHFEALVFLRSQLPGSKVNVCLAQSRFCFDFLHYFLLCFPTQEYLHGIFYSNVYIEGVIYTFPRVTIVSEVWPLDIIASTLQISYAQLDKGLLTDTQFLSSGRVPWKHFQEVESHLSIPNSKYFERTSWARLLSHPMYSDEVKNLYLSFPVSCFFWFLDFTSPHVSRKTQWWSGKASPQSDNLSKLHMTISISLRHSQPPPSYLLLTCIVKNQLRLPSNSVLGNYVFIQYLDEDLFSPLRTQPGPKTAFFKFVRGFSQLLSFSICRPYFILSSWTYTEHTFNSLVTPSGT